MSLISTWMGDHMTRAFKSQHGKLPAHLLHTRTHLLVLHTYTHVLHTPSTHPHTPPAHPAHIFAKNWWFFKFGKKWWFFFKFWQKMMIFQNLGKIDDFFAKICFIKLRQNCQNRTLCTALHIYLWLIDFYTWGSRGHQMVRRFSQIIASHQVIHCLIDHNLAKLQK